MPIFAPFFGGCKKVRNLRFYIDVGSRGSLLLYLRNDFHYRPGLGENPPKILGAPRSRNFKICPKIWPLFHLPQKVAFFAKIAQKCAFLGANFDFSGGWGPLQQRLGHPLGHPDAQMSMGQGQENEGRPHVCTCCRHVPCGVKARIATSSSRSCVILQFTAS